MNNNLDNTLLIVDDDDRFRERLAKAFQQRNFTVTQAPSLSHVVELVKHTKWKRAVVDLCLLDGNGLQVINSLRNSDPEIEIVVLTGYGTIDTAVEAMKLGAVNYLNKPADADSIIEAFEPDTASKLENIRLNNNNRSDSLSHIEKEHIQKVLLDCKGNITKAAKRLGIHRRSLQRKLSRGEVS